MAIQAFRTHSPWSMTEMGRANQLKQEQGASAMGAVRFVQGRPYIAVMKKACADNSPSWSPLTSKNTSLGSPPRSPRGSRLIPMQHRKGSGATYRFPFNLDPTKDPTSRLNPENVIMTPTSPVPATSRGSSIVLYGTLKSDTYQRPSTTPKPYKLSTPLRSRRPDSVQGFYPPGKVWIHCSRFCRTNFDPLVPSFCELVILSGKWCWNLS